MFARCVQIIAGNEMAERGRVGGEYRLRNSASSRFYRFTWTRTMGELLASHKCAQLPLFFSLSLSRFQFFFFLFRSTRGRIYHPRVYHRVCERNGEIIEAREYTLLSRARSGIAWPVFR